MSPPVHLQVPGKVVLMGEYAVLDGAPGLVAAVDRGVQVTATAGPVLTIETPGSDDHFVRPALERIGVRGAFRFEAWNPVDPRWKVGLGTSAAATVAAVRAGLLVSGESADPAAVFAHAKAVHHQVQGSGSGIDVAASTYGGVLRYRDGQPTPARPLELPWTLVWSGASAKTGPRVARYLAWADRDEFVARSAELVEAFDDNPIEALRDARQLLEDMADQAGLSYRTPALDRIAALADQHGGAAKPSGAGGGDIAIAIFPDLDALGRFDAACATERLPSFAVDLVPGEAIPP